MPKKMRAGERRHFRQRRTANDCALSAQQMGIRGKRIRLYPRQDGLEPFFPHALQFAQFAPQILHLFLDLLLLLLRLLAELLLLTAQFTP
jgi:hypothetical protein